MARPPTAIRKTDTIDPAFVARVEALGFGQVGRTDEYRGHCLDPDHPDEHPSCYINVRKRVAICRSCKNTWSSAELTATLDLLERTAGAAATAPPRDHRAARGPIVATHDYVDAAGALVFQVVQFQTDPGKPKDFQQRRPSSRPGEWVYTVKDLVKVPFHLPMVTKAIGRGAPIVFVEGEKCAKALAALKIVATTTAGGARSWEDHYASHFADADVIIWPDHDAPGHAYAVAVATGLVPVARRVRWVDSTGDLGDDVVDFLAANGADAVRARLESARPMGSVREIPDNPHDPPSALRVIDVVTELPTHTFPEREMLLTPWLETGNLPLAYGPPGVGKTRFAMSIAAAVGGTVGRYHAHRPARVLYVDGELQGRRVRGIFGQALGAVRAVPAPGFLMLITPDAQPDSFAPNLAESATQRALLGRIDEMHAEVVFLDNLSCLWSVEDDNAASQWDDLQSFLLTLRRRGVATVLLHHAGKNGKQLGTSKKEFIVDTTIKLSRPEDYDASQGTRFLVEYEKARGFIAGAEKFEAALVEEGGVARWKHYVPTDPRVEALRTAIEALRARGVEPTVRKLAAETGLGKNVVQGLKERLL